MKILLIPFVLGLLFYDTTGVPHSLKYFYTASSGIPDFPEFVAVGLVDDVQIIHWESNTGRAQPKQDWMLRAKEDDPQYWEWEKEQFKSNQWSLQVSIENVKPRFNQTGGVHLVQKLYGCEWDDETDEVNGFYQFGYDGEDFIALDLNTQTWTTAKSQAVTTKQKWDKDKAWTARDKNYLTQICPEWLKKYVDYGRSTLKRTDLPSVSFLQKSPSSPVTCHATGFYPNSAVMFWRKDGEELQEDVEHGEIIPNHDGSFQMSVDLLKPPSDDWGRYECVFQLDGVKEEKVYKLNKDKLRTNYVDTNMIIGIVIGVALVLLAVGLAGFFWMKLRKCKETNWDAFSNTSSELSEKLNQAPTPPPSPPSTL